MAGLEGCWNMPFGNCGPFLHAMICPEKAHTILFMNFHHLLQVLKICTKLQT